MVSALKEPLESLGQGQQRGTLGEGHEYCATQQREPSN